MAGFITYAGSKDKIKEQIKAHILSSDAKNFVDLFCGACSVTEFVCNDFKICVANDVNINLINSMRLLCDCEFTGFDRNTFYNDLLENAPTTQEEYLELRKIYNEHVNRNIYSYKTNLMFIELALSCTNNMVRFNRKKEFNQTYGKRKVNTKSIEKMEKFVSNIIESGNVCFTFGSYRDLSIPEDFLIYIDPPYSNTGTKYFGWNDKDDIELADWICSQDNDILVSSISNYNGKKSTLVEILKERGFKEHEIECDYEKVARKKSKQTTEVILKNYGD